MRKLFAQLAGWRIHVVAMAAGALATLAFAPFYVAPAYVLGLCVLVWLLDEAAQRPNRVKVAGLRALSFAFGHFLSGLYWVGAAFTQVDGAMVLMPFAVLGLAFVLAAIWGAAGAVAMLGWTKDLRRLPWLAFVLACAEWVRGHLFGGLPWNLAGYIWEAGTAISQAAAYIGIYGLTAFTLLIALAPAAFADEDRPWGARAAPTLVAAVLLGLVWGVGLDRLQSAGPPSAKGPGPIVRVVDPGLTQREKWEPGREWEVFARYLKLSGAPSESDSAIVIWPEAAIPVRYPDVPPLTDNPQMMAAVGRTMGDRVLIAGALRVDPQTRPPMIYNTAFVIDAVAGRPEIGQRHDKYRLTPGGEFIPLYQWISWLPIKSLQQIGEGFSRGDPPTRMVVPGAADVLVLICYESIFPGLVPRGAERPGWIANISIDAWYGTGTGPFQNDNQSRYRAIEEGLPMARAASGGVSSITDPYGRKVVTMDRKGGAVEAPLPAALPQTINASYGALLTAALMLIIGLLRIAPFGRRRQDHHE